MYQADISRIIIFKYKKHKSSFRRLQIKMAKNTPFWFNPKIIIMRIKIYLFIWSFTARLTIRFRTSSTYKEGMQMDTFSLSVCCPWKTNKISSFQALTPYRWLTVMPEWNCDPRFAKCFSAEFQTTRNQREKLGDFKISSTPVYFLRRGSKSKQGLLFEMYGGTYGFLFKFNIEILHMLKCKSLMGV